MVIFSILNAFLHAGQLSVQSWVAKEVLIYYPQLSLQIKYFKCKHVCTSVRLMLGGLHISLSSKLQELHCLF